MESLVRPHKHICLSQCGLLNQILNVSSLTAPRAVLDRVLKTNTSIFNLSFATCSSGRQRLSAIRSPDSCSSTTVGCSAFKTSSRFLGRLEKPAQRLAMGVTHRPTWLHYTVSERAISLLRNSSHDRTSTRDSVTPREGGYRRITPHSDGVWFLQPVFCCTQ